MQPGSGNPLRTTAIDPTMSCVYLVCSVDLVSGTSGKSASSRRLRSLRRLRAASIACCVRCVYCVRRLVRRVGRLGWLRVWEFGVTLPAILRGRRLLVAGAEPTDLR